MLIAKSHDSFIFSSKNIFVYIDIFEFVCTKAFGFAYSYTLKF